MSNIEKNDPDELMKAHEASKKVRRELQARAENVVNTQLAGPDPAGKSPKTRYPPTRIP